LEQFQGVGSSVINEIKNILITVLSAKLVIDGDITLGMLLAISYIVGQLNSPIAQFINFVRELQDAQISLDRLSEIHEKKDEESDISESINDINVNADFNLSNLSFRYIGSEKKILEDLDLQIPANKVTAIVGVSGSGKTTLMKLLLKFYVPLNGDIKLGNHDLKHVSQKVWRNECGVVMQEGYIFNDTIANNIAVEDDYIDKKRKAKVTYCQSGL
jgi:ATP-binding cassette subfamily B protein